MIIKNFKLFFKRLVQVFLTWTVMMVSAVNLPNLNKMST